jgi:hypothetical protein
MAKNGFSKRALLLAVSIAGSAAVWLCPISAPADHDLPPVVVMMLSQDQRKDSVAVADAVKAQLSDLEVALVIREVESFPGSLADQIAGAGVIAREERVIAVFWYDLSTEDQVYLFLAGRGGKRVLVRKLEESKDRGRAEGLAIIVRSSAIAMMQGGEIGITVAEALEKNAASPKKPDEMGPRDKLQKPQALGPEAGLEDERLSIGIAYAYNARHTKHPALNGLGLGMDLRLVWKLRLTAGFYFFQPIHGKGDLASATIRRHPIHLGLGLEVDLGGFRLSGFAATVVDFVEQEVSGLSPGMSEGSDMNDVVFGVLAMLGAIAPLTPRLDVFLLLGALTVFNERRYDVKLGGETETLIDSWPVQPSMLAGISVKVM